jgi:arylsulfatase A-like enzyme
VPWYTAVVQDGWKYIRYLQPGVPEEMYNLGSDPEERKNLAGEARHAKRLGTLRTALIAELKRTSAPATLLPKAP